MKILVLDDNEGFRREIADILTHNGCDVDTVDSAPAAIQPAESGKYDVVFVDYQMPEYDGLWFMKQVKLPRDTKVLLVTAHVNKELVNAMFEVGISGYVMKPFNEEDLLRHLDFHAPQYAEGAVSKQSEST